MRWRLHAVALACLRKLTPSLCVWLCCVFFQTIPYVYVHLISLMNMLYLICFGAYKGMAFHPEETIAFGLFFPLCTTIIISVTCTGLLAAGTLLADPLGSDVTDFAVLSFLRSCSANSRQVILEQSGWLDTHGRGPVPGEVEAQRASQSVDYDRASMKTTTEHQAASSKGVSWTDNEMEA